MAALFCIGLLAYYAVFLATKSGASGELAKLLWWTYFGLGCSALLIASTGVFQPVFQPNYPAILFLLLCISISISGFLGFRQQDVRDVIVTARGQAPIEVGLIGLQLFSIAFFLPFAISSFAGDAGVNRLELSNKAAVLASYGLINTIAGFGSHLFAASLVMAFIRLAQPKGEGYSPYRALLLTLCSLSYVIYVLAYVGRDGSIYWLMTALLVFIVFRKQLSTNLQRRIIISGVFMCGLVLVPIAIITIARFADSQNGVNWSILEYYGTQINTFSDYSSIDRPRTYGVMNFPMVVQAYCSAFYSQNCVSWEDVKPQIFDQYLAQGKPPWLFGTFVSDFVADFGGVSVVALLTAFAFLCHRACVGRDHQGRMSLSRLLLIVFYFLTPYWGVFYFRFGIINSFLLVNIAFIGLVWLIQSSSTTKRIGRAPASSA